MLTQSLTMPTAEFEAATGWAIKPEGACKGDLCVPLGAPVEDLVDLSTLAPKLGMAVVEHDDRFAIGPESLTNRALTTAVAPDLELPDLDGNPFKLSSLRGQKIVVYAWAPY